MAGYFLARTSEGPAETTKISPFYAAWNELVCRILIEVSAGAQYIWGFGKGLVE